MTKSLKQKRGTTAFNDALVGDDGEITLDLEKREFRIHDGVTPGGTVVGGGSGGPLGIEGALDVVADLPAPAGYPEGTTFIIDGAYWSLVDGVFIDVGTIRGPGGLSAYELAQSAGFRGSANLWLETLRGSDGIGLRILGERRFIGELPLNNNLNGDAFVVSRVMWVWVNTRWIEVGQVGPRGESAFQLAKERNLIPDNYTLLEYLNSLHGKDAYELAIVDEYIPTDWTRREWLESLHGKSAYDLAVREGRFDGPVSGWLNSLRGDQGPQGDRGVEGPIGQPSNAIVVMGRVQSENDLPQGQDPGDAYYIDRDLHVYNGDVYINVGPVVGEKGDVGVQGPMGPAGELGLQGNSAYDVAVSEGVFSGTVAQWVLSLTGNSAFEAAREAFGGDIGTEDEWVLSLYGKDAYETALDRGEIDVIEDAYAYFRGTEGLQGVQGVIGVQGPRGLEGYAVRVLGIVASVDDLPAEVVNGDGFLIDENLHVAVNGDWTNVGPVRGPVGPLGPKGDVGERGDDGFGVRYIGRLTQNSDLPVSGAETHDAYVVGTVVYSWSGTAWVELGELIGPKGDQGPIGVEGPQGVIGPIGVNGPKGEQGQIGYSGPQGPQGGKGWTGSKGSTGPRGYTGSGGSRGPRGWGGSQGARGYTGPRGLMGNTGDRGYVGAQGVRGPIGRGITVAGQLSNSSLLPSNWDTDNSGFLINEDMWLFDPGAGNWFNAGPVQGPQGVRGIQGIKGDVGAPLKVRGSVDNVGMLPTTQVDAGDSYMHGTVMWTYTGSQWINVGTIRGPQGLRGFTGLKGDVGAPLNIRGSVTNVSALPTSNRSAGDVYLVGLILWSYSGTEWVNAGSIQGPQGSEGTQGLVGAQGDEGPQGTPGTVGPIGNTGPIGIQGDEGDLGPKGDTGLVGDTGPQGPRGSTGPIGEYGPEGVRGPRGSVWINAQREPDVLDGDPGDYFINTVSRGYYVKMDSVQWLFLGTLDGTNFVDAPTDGRQYLRRNGGWADIDVVEAPRDGEHYVRRSGQWVTAPTGLPDAPDDGKTYNRKERDWVVNSLDDAPNDGVFYGRRGGKWVGIDSYTVKAVNTTGILDLSQAQAFTLDGTEDVNVVLDRAPEIGRSMTVVLTINGGTGTVTWPVSINWNNSVPPSLGTTHTVVVLLWTGSIWVGSVGITI